MLFNSFQYFVFLIAVIVIYFIIPNRWRTWLLLTASYCFYMCWRWEYGFLLLGITLINYICARFISISIDTRIKKMWLFSAVGLSIGSLIFFKYFNFLNDTLRYIFQASAIGYHFNGLDILLPVGISFFTFQALGYTIDVYYGRYRVEKNLGRFALYVSFFPQLVAGPIERAGNLLAQFKKENHFDLIRLTEGMKLILWGLFKKMVIADQLADYVNRVYGNPDLYSGSTLLLATYFFAFQIYCDFSGYSDIAIGSARILGYDLMQNFRLPYLATSIRDFWKRWHISLTSWFADYVYIPLGGNKVSQNRWILNILVVFVLSGLWHGANWTFITWGGLNGFYYITEAFLMRSNLPLKAGFLPASVKNLIKCLVTFHLILLSWVFFRAENLSDAFLIIERIFTETFGRLYFGPSQLETFVGILLVLILVVVQLFQKWDIIILHSGISKVPAVLRWSGYLLLLHGLALLSKGSNEFIYFQF